MKKILCASLLAMLPVVVMYAGEKDSLMTNDSIVMSYQVDEVVIVAFKSNDQLAKQPLSASMLTGRMIKERNLTTIKELSGFVPNFFMPDYGSKLTSPVYIRGIGSRINAPSVGLYVDGIPYFDRSSFDFDLNDIERVEVLRGPQGTLYGRNTMGGIINVYTRSPFKLRESNINASGGNYEHYKFGASHVGNLNGKFGYSFSGNYMHNGGYFKNLYTNKMADGIDLITGRIRLGWSINPQMKLFLTSAYEYSDQDGYPYGVYDAETRKVGKVNYDAPSFYRRNMSNNGLTFEYTNNYISLSSQTSFQYIDGKQGIDQDFTPEDKYYVTFTHHQRMYSQEANIRSVNDCFYKWQFGLFGFYQDYNQSNDIEYRQLNRETITDVANPTIGFAVYHQSSVDDILLNGLSATFGIRYDWERIKMENNTQKIVASDITLDPVIYGKDIYTQVTPKFSLRYMLTNKDLVYASVSKGYKAGGFNTTVEEEKDRIFKPEHSWSYELGAKSTFFDQLVSLDVSLFYIDWKNQQISQKRATEQGFKLRNAGESTSKGVEVTTTIRPVSNLNFQLNYGYTHATFKEYLYDEDKGIDYGGNFIPLVPRNTFSAITTYNWNVNKSWLDRIVLNAQYIGLGKLYWNEDNITKQNYYQMLNADISFIKKGISVGFWAKNILNEKYITYYFESMGDRFAQQGKPFTIGVDVNVKF